MEPLVFIIAYIFASHLVSEFAIRGIPKLEETRWFLVHFLVNLLVTFCTASHVAAFFVKPSLLYKDSTYASKLPIAAVIGVHMYHVLWYDLRREDFFHHFVFLPTIGVPGYLYEWGGIGNLQLFFICGLPGMVLYYVLIMKRTRSNFDPNLEPALTAYLNVWVRMPGVLIANFLLLYAFFNGFVNPPVWAFLCQVVLAPVNAIYYARQAWFRYENFRAYSNL